MKKEHRPLIVLFIRDKWCVFCMKKKVSSGFNTKKEAEEYKEYLRSR